MATTYTPPTGLTSPALSTGSLMDTLASITGQFPAANQAMQDASQMQANRPLVQAQDQVGLANKFQIPQSTDYYSKIVDLYMHDKNLNQQYQGNIGNTPITTMPGTDVVSAVPRLTPDNLNQPFSGFTDPALAAQAGLQGTKGVMSTLGNLSDFIKAGSEKIGKQFDVDMSAYDAAIKGKMDLVDRYLSMYKELRQSGLSEKDLADLQLKGAEMGMKYDIQKHKWVEDPAGGGSIADDYATQVMSGNLKFAGVPKEFKNRVNEILTDKGYEEHKLPDAQMKAQTEDLEALQLINTIKKAMNDPQQSARLKKLFGGPQSAMIKLAYENQVAYPYVLSMLGVQPQDEPVISAINSLTAARDRQLLGGRVTGYLYKMLMPGAMTLDKGFDYNKSLANDTFKRITDRMKARAENYKFKDWMDLPGLKDMNLDQKSTPDSGSARLVDPKGELYEYDSTSDPIYIKRLKQGWRPA